MAAINQPISFTAGEDIQVTIPITKAGAPLEVDGCTFVWKAYSTLTGVVLTKDDALIGGIIINDDKESISLLFANEDTKDLTPLTYDYELRIITPTGAQNILTEGLFTLGRSITLIGDDS
ncbi:MAG: hypothetical protein ABSC64_02250 [Candidatus Korobacteraceae bacterium]|jgi:hypothetical protein